MPGQFQPSNFCFLPTDPASIGGQKLLHTADINISSCVTSFFRCRVRSEKTGADKPRDLRQASWFGKRKMLFDVVKLKTDSEVA